jgi:hypothetical protein
MLRAAHRLTPVVDLCWERHSNSSKRHRGQDRAACQRARSRWDAAIENQVDIGTCGTASASDRSSRASTDLAGGSSGTRCSFVSLNLNQRLLAGIAWPECSFYRTSPRVAATLRQCDGARVRVRDTAGSSCAIWRSCAPSRRDSGPVLGVGTRFASGSTRPRPGNANSSANQSRCGASDSTAP